jgi:hypothetical protein
MPTKTDIVLIGLGVLAAVVLTWKIPTTVATMSSVNSLDTTSGCSKCSQLTLDKISGIDIDALNICRQKGIM